METVPTFSRDMYRQTKAPCRSHVGHPIAGQWEYLYKGNWHRVKNPDIRLALDAGNTGAEETGSFPCR